MEVIMRSNARTIRIYHVPWPSRKFEQYLAENGGMCSAAKCQEMNRLFSLSELEDCVVVSDWARRAVPRHQMQRYLVTYQVIL